MKYIFNEPKIEYTVRELINSYIPKTKFEICDTIPEDDDYTYVNIISSDSVFFYDIRISINGEVKKVIDTYNALSKTFVSNLVSQIMMDFTGIELPWGILTGIRPAKMVRELIESGENTEKIYNTFINEYKVRPDKAKLAIEVAKTESEIAKNINNNAVSLYIGIPFCPTRCLYCSFTSQSIKFSNTLVEPYMDAMLKEIDYVSEYIRNNDIPIETIYIGGGTPTALDENNLFILTDKIQKSFDIDKVKEYTVEAGRPDTITTEKLRILKNASVSRISINPQSMNQKTLDIIGRKHTPDDIIKSYEDAVNTGFSHINMDLIAGLPGENAADFSHTLDMIKSIDPSSVTIHTLSIKHGSYLDMNYSMYTPSAAQTVDNMLTAGEKALKSMDMHPYYMYRQKNMLGNLENIGYCKKGYECVYNIYIMDEIQSIISIGAGASTKIVNNDKIERVFNVKEVSEYIKRIDEMIDRKKKLFQGVKYL